MPINNVSFGAVVAVFGNPDKVRDIHSKLNVHAQRGEVMMKDVTRHYRTSYSGGMMEEAARNGDKVELYITKNDIKHIRNGKGDWTTLDGILSNMSSFFKVDRRTSVDEAVNKILNSR